jgi:hypothetical protein
MPDFFSSEELLKDYDPSGAQERYDDNKTTTKIGTTAGRRLGRPLGVKNGEGTKKEPLRKLTPKHYEMIALHLRGKGLREIAETINCTYATAWRVMNDPLARQVIDEFYEAYKADLMGLFPIAVDAVREGLNDKDSKTRLLAIDRFVRLKESVIDEVSSGAQVNITIVNDARKKLVSTIKAKIETLTEQPDGSFTPT